MRLIKLASVAAALALSVGACDEGLTDLNENPNAPEEVGPELLFPQGVTSAVGNVRGSNADLHLTSLWAQHFSKIQYVDEDWYQIRPQNNEAYWTNLYSGALQDLTDAVERAEAADRPNQVAPAMIMKAWTFGAITDLWGDIPFSEANRGDEGITSPVYDTQEDVYQGIFAMLEEAAGMIPGTGAGYGSADPVYGGDVAKWELFANSIRARHGMRLSEVDAATAEAVVVDALSAGVFESLDDQAVLEWPGDGVNDNPLFNFNVTNNRDDHRISATMVTTLQGLNDPRLPIYAQRPLDATVPGFVGVENGLSSDSAGQLGLSKTSRIGMFFGYDADAPTILMSYWEVLFIRAEAAARGWTTENAATLYADAIRASMEYYGIGDAAIDAYLAQSSVAYSAATGLTQIALQKWISLYGQGSEAFAEWRRTGVPTLEPGMAAITNPRVVARRLTYPLIEQSLNKANHDAAVARQGGADLEDRVWWDVP
ncbi:MAG TPA: SusD/RagB family nutrient-binding outer membrane lipoprotein [Gemmatimonadaceae bacterium]|nr:SusD/RagB family nutrient-binding outer membrane lipoprotein [Gemmatimonadaceae bacterium]